MASLITHLPPDLACPSYGGVWTFAKIYIIMPLTREDPSDDHLQNVLDRGETARRSRGKLLMTGDTRADPSAPRRSIIRELGAETVEEAIEVISRSRYATTRERNSDLLIRYLRGDTIKGAGAAHGVSGSRASMIMHRAMSVLRGELRPVSPETRILDGLSIPARNGLKNGMLKWDSPPLTDEAVRGWVRENGAKALLGLTHMGPKTQREVCEAFGFDPNESRDEMSGHLRHILSRLDANTVEQAVGIIHLAGRLDIGDWDRDRGALLSFLDGRTYREIGAELGIGTSRVGGLVNRAFDRVHRAISAQQNHRLTLSLLSHRAQNGLMALGLRTDAQVLVHLRLLGTGPLLETAGVGPATIQEICDAFGFRPETDRHPCSKGTEERSAWTDEQLVAAVQASGQTASQMRRSALCACFRCVAIFPSEWLFGTFEQAWCPRCGAQAILPGNEVPEIRNPDFLRAVRDR
jgi:hypothetical protein